MACHCTSILIEPELNSKFVWLVSHILYNRTPGFAWEKLFINSQIEVWYIAFLTIFYEAIPHLGNQAKFVSFSPLPPTKKVVEPQMFHNFLVPITAHCISKD